MIKNKIYRGDLYYYDFGEKEGSIQSGIRPVLVVQANEFNTNAPTIIVAAITTVMKKRYLPSHIILGESFGLKKPSMVLLEQIQTVNKIDLLDYIGTIDDERIIRLINNTLKKTFGLWFYKKVDENNIRNLCPNCLKDYMNTKSYLIRRLDPFAKRKCKCEKCEKYGWQYIVTKKEAQKNKKIKYGIS